MDKITVHMLAAERRRQIQHQQEWGDLYDDSGLVFTTDHGRPLNLDTVSQHFDRLIARYEAIRRSPERPPGRGIRTTPEALAAAYRLSRRAVDLALAGPPLPPIRLHDLRHVAACLAYRATKDLKLVSELMGHSGIQITADIYTSLVEEVDRAAAEAVAAIVPASTIRSAAMTAATSMTSYRAALLILRAAKCRQPAGNRPCARCAHQRTIRNYLTPPGRATSQVRTT